MAWPGASASLRGYIIDQLFCNKHGCTFRVHPQQTEKSQLRYDVADLLERTTPNAAEWDGNKTEFAGWGFSVTDDEATGESMVVAYFTCNTYVEYPAAVLKAPRTPVTVSPAGPTTLQNSDTGVAGSLLDEPNTAWHKGILGQHYRNGTTPPLNALCTEVEDACESHAIVELHAALAKAGSKSICHNATAVNAAAKAADAAAADVEEQEHEAYSLPLASKKGGKAEYSESETRA
eukprot:jgi/Tetstr1/429100/TSEL_019063.t1